MVLPHNRCNHVVSSINEAENCSQTLTNWIGSDLYRYKECALQIIPMNNEI
jgi:hypothetical protein